MEFYTVLGLDQTPKKLRSVGESCDLYCYFPPPLPEFFVVFCLQWSEKMKEKMSVQLFLDSDDRNICKTIGEVSKDSSAICFKGDWNEDEESIADEIQAKGRLLKLLITPADPASDDMDSQDSGISSETVLFSKNELSPRSRSDSNEKEQKNKKPFKRENRKTLLDFSFGETKKSQQTRGGPLKRKSIFDFDDDKKDERKKHINGETLKYVNSNKENSKKISNDLMSPIKRMEKSIKKSPYRFKNLSDNKSRTCTTAKSPATPGLFDLQEPSPRWGHTFCEVEADKAILIGGQGMRNQICKDSIWQYNFGTNHFERIDEESSDASRRMGHTATYSEASSQIFVFGGSKSKRWYSDVHALDLNTMKWRKLEPTGKPPVRAYHSCTLVYDELLVFGGVYPNPDPMPDGCSNEVYFFNTETNSWYQPIVRGEKPNARSGHSACLVDGLLYIFGGWDAPTCFDDLWTLDIGLMNFTKLEVVGKAPSSRSWHGAMLTSDQQSMLVCGGYNGDQALSDVHVFRIASRSWSQLETNSNIARAGHKLLKRKRHRKDGKVEDSIVVFGGGNNEGDFYNDLLELPMKLYAAL
ncbi:rab9 effector protein with kelch motifs-like [Rhopilema esculentum]|uniref:rab9 effector protein with kelch motifs-like n=1 Tax=Rhopilema esculentum TaxID=499914 RepID=UPI0031CF2BE8